jgi:uncharacterized protein (DUF4415 family)
VRKHKTAAIASDPATDFYDPNDPTAVTDYWAQSTIKRGHGRPAMSVKRPTLNMQIDTDVIQAFKKLGWGNKLQSTSCCVRP